jgi:hypothetical protein
MWYRSRNHAHCNRHQKKILYHTQKFWALESVAGKSVMDLTWFLCSYWGVMSPRRPRGPNSVFLRITGGLRETPCGPFLFRVDHFAYSRASTKYYK